MRRPYAGDELHPPLWKILNSLSLSLSLSLNLSQSLSLALYFVMLCISGGGGLRTQKALEASAGGERSRTELAMVALATPCIAMQGTLSWYSIWTLEFSNLYTAVDTQPEPRKSVTIVAL